MSVALERNNSNRQLSRAVMTAFIVLHAGSISFSARGQNVTSSPQASVSASPAAAQPLTVSSEASSSKPTPSGEPVPTYAASCPSPDFSVNPATKSLTIQYETKSRGSMQGLYVTNGKPGSDPIIIDVSATLSFPPEIVNVKIKVAFGKNNVPIEYTIPDIRFDRKKNEYTIKERDLAAFARYLVRAINDVKSGFDADTPIAFSTPASLALTPLIARVGFVSRELPVQSTLPIVMKQVVAKPLHVHHGVQECQFCCESDPSRCGKPQHCCDENEQSSQEHPQCCEEQGQCHEHHPRCCDKHQDCEECSQCCDDHYQWREEHQQCCEEHRHHGRKHPETLCRCPGSGEGPGGSATPRKGEKPTPGGEEQPAGGAKPAPTAPKQPEGVAKPAPSGAVSEPGSAKQPQGESNPSQGKPASAKPS